MTLTSLAVRSICQHSSGGRDGKKNVWNVTAMLRSSLWRFLGEGVWWNFVSSDDCWVYLTVIEVIESLFSLSVSSRDVMIQIFQASYLP